MTELSIVLPALNESANLGNVLKKLIKLYPDAEIIVVDDGSTDDTPLIAKQTGVKLVSHPYSMGNGAAIKSGTRNASGDAILFMDADGQHKPDDIPAMLSKYLEGYDMVIGARSAKTHASILRRIGNSFYNALASFMTGYRIHDLTSGFRLVNARKFKKFLYLMPNGFSYPTTSTMAFFRSGYSIEYVPINVQSRKGKSKIRFFKDGVRFVIIILKIGALFSPMRLFLPISLFLFLTGITYYGYTYITSSRFTNMSMLLFVSSLMIFLIGIVSEQVSSLHYKDTGNFNDKNG